MGEIQERLDATERRANDVLPGPLKIGLLTLYLHSTRGSDRFDALADRPSVRRWSDLAIAVLIGVQASGLLVVALAAVRALGQTGTTALNDPVNTVAIPGLNAFMPLASAPYVVIALVVATVVHEGGHALACRAEGVRVREWGVALLLGVVPLAGYVLPGDELDDAPRRSQLRVYSVGVLHNLVVASAAFALLLSSITASPLDAFVTYFGWAAVGGPAPTATAVASLGVLTNLAFWLALLNANFGLLNALPVSVLDGGRVLRLWLERLNAWTGLGLSRRVLSVVVHGASVLVVGLVATAIVGPYLWT